MNHDFAKEVGYFRFFVRKLLWRIGCVPDSMKLRTGVSFPLPKSKFFAADVFVSSGNVDWNSEYILASFLGDQPDKREFLDVGAHIGYYSSLLSPLVSKVYSFEPDSRNHPYLNETLGGLPNATLVPKAVSDCCGIVSFSDDADSAISHIDLTAISNDGSTTETVTIDWFVIENGLNPIAVKIDIEGFDILALRGAIKTSKTCSPVFLVEYNQEDDRPNTWDALLDFIVTTNYTIFCVSRIPKGWHDFTYTFSKREVSELQALSTKMLFLVPAEHLVWFSTFVTKNGIWNGNGLRRCEY